MQIEIKNSIGKFVIGGGKHPNARLREITGLGPPGKDIQTITFAGQPGRTQTNMRDMERVITMSFDFFGGISEIEKLYRLIYNEVDIIITTSMKKRKITGICLNSSEIEKIIYHKWQRLVLQFTCNEPYFKDPEPYIIPIFKRTDLFPNAVSEDGAFQLLLPAVATMRTTEATIINTGDVKIYPLIRLVNSSETSALSETVISIYNSTIGAKITLEYLAKTGEEIVIDLPHRKIISNINGDITKHICDDTVLGNFFLNVGENAVSAVMNNSSIGLVVTVEYSNNYASAVI